MAPNPQDFQVCLHSRGLHICSWKPLLPSKMWCPILWSSRIFWNLINYVTHKILAWPLYHIVHISYVLVWGLGENRCFRNATWINEWQNCRALWHARQCPTLKVLCYLNFAVLSLSADVVWERKVTQKSQPATFHVAPKYKDGGFYFFKLSLSLTLAHLILSMINPYSSHTRSSETEEDREPGLRSPLAGSGF